ncbi:MAG TPA: hypothetical protein VK203_00405 [Nostocaceae cyanobacterium]|nr:hypothetical protein [Nostocaceae cyanobacterium]
MTVDSVSSLLVDLLQNIPEVVCAYELDVVGDKMAAAVNKLLPPATNTIFRKP